MKKEEISIRYICYNTGFKRVTHVISFCSRYEYYWSCLTYFVRFSVYFVNVWGKKNLTFWAYRRDPLSLPPLSLRTNQPRNLELET